MRCLASELWFQSEQSSLQSVLNSISKSSELIETLEALCMLTFHNEKNGSISLCGLGKQVASASTARHAMVEILVVCQRDAIRYRLVQPNGHYLDFQVASQTGSEVPIQTAQKRLEQSEATEI